MRPNTGALSARFEVRVGQCGLSSSGNIENNGQPNPAGSYLENTIIVQYDPQVQEVWDQGGGGDSTMQPASHFTVSTLSRETLQQLVGTWY